MADRSFWRAIPGLYGALPEALQGEIDRIAAAPSEVCLANCRAAAQGWSIGREQVRLTLAPTIPHHCADDFFRACRAMADKFGLGIHTHVAESKVQAVVGRQKYGKTLTTHLDDLGLIGPNFTAAHAVWVDDQDLRILSERGASIAHNPTSNVRLGVGLARVPAMLGLGLNVGIGTDTSTCSDLLNMFEAMRLACYVSRAQSPDPAEWLCAEQALVMATQGSARALGIQGAIGKLAQGSKADLVFLDLAGLAYMPLNHAARQVVFQETGAGVESVMVGGRFIVRGRRLLTVDLDRLRRDAEAANERLLAANRAGAELVRRLEPIVGAFCVGLAKERYHVHRYADH